MQVKMLAGGSILMLVLGLGGCGSDSGVAVNNVSGVLTQGPVQGATIFADRIGAGTASLRDSNELYTTTDADGNFSLQIPVNYGSYRLVSQGGIDKITQKPAMEMVAPAGAKNVTPLTTLVALAPAADQAALKAKIEATGIKFDADISKNAPTDALVLTKSVETAMESLRSILDKDSAKFDTATMGSIQEVALSAIAKKLAAPAVTDVTDSAVLATQITSAIKDDALPTIEAAHADVIAITDNTVVANAIGSTVTAVGTQFSGITTQVVNEADLYNSSFNSAIASAVTTSVSTAAPAVTVTDNLIPTVVATKTSLTGVAINATVTVTFSENVSNVDGTTFTVKKGSSAVAGVMSYNASTKTATFVPNADFVNGTTYTVTLTSGIKDAAGNALAPTTLTFTTVALPVTGSSGTSGSAGTGANF